MANGLDYSGQFSTVVGPGGSQSDVFRIVGLPLVEATLKGHRACLFSYGQVPPIPASSRARPAAGHHKLRPTFPSLSTPSDPAPCVCNPQSTRIDSTPRHPSPSYLIPSHPRRPVRGKRFQCMALRVAVILPSWTAWCLPSVPSSSVGSRLAPSQLKSRAQLAPPYAA